MIMAKQEKKTLIKTNNLDDPQKLLSKEFGDGIVMRGRGSIVKVDAFPTDVASIDIALGCGGIPLGRIVELFGAGVS